MPRLLNCTPQELLALGPNELFEAVKGSEGRTVYACARCKGPNLVQNVSNAEMCASMGADIVKICYYDPRDPMFPGLPSKDASLDEVYAKVQIQPGRGWRPAEIRRLIGRPIAVEMFVDTATDELTELLLADGFDIICVYGFEFDEEFLPTVKRLARRVEGRALLEAGILHGPKLKNAPFNMKELQTPEFAKRAVDAGARLFQAPAVATLPGFTIEYVGRLADAIHEQGGLCITGIHSSLEGSQPDLIQKIALDCRAAGADIHMIGDAGINENMASPELITALSIALRGYRHTYKRMCQSVLR